MLLAVFLPLFNFLILSLFGRFFGKLGTIYITIYNLILMIGLNFYLFYNVYVYNTSFFILLGSWIEVGLLSVNWEFTFDALAVSILVIISIVSTIVHLYSISYIKYDPHFIRFISYLSLFTFFMFILVTASNLVQFFLGWEGVGICSYLLINFWYTRVQANKAALKALIINRIGDIGFLLGLVATFYYFRTLDISLLQTFHLTDFFEQKFVHYSNRQVWFNFWYEYRPKFAWHVFFKPHDVICLLFFIGVAAKSAQLGLHTWLPSAIEGPTPVSALIHAATMVTAGVFLLIRLSFIFDISPIIRLIIVIFGASTALFSALTAIFLYDIKRIIAYSTCSQLGYIIFACGASQYSVGLFHLINHAFFKALLFLTAGAIIHSFQNEQDIRKLSGVFFKSPFLFTAMFIGNFAIMGIPFLSGFYSKDLIIELSALFSIVYHKSPTTLLFLIMALATFCTGVYSWRLFYFLFLRQGTEKISTFQQINQPFFIQIALSILIICSIFGGYCLSDLFSPNNDFLYYTNHAFNSTRKYVIFDKHIISAVFLQNEFLPWFIKLTPFFCNLLSLSGALLFIYLYNNFYVPRFLPLAIDWLKHKYIFQTENWIISFLTVLLNVITFSIKIIQNNFYFNELYNYWAINTFTFCFFLFSWLDKGFFEFFGPRGLSIIYTKIATYTTYLFKQKLSTHLILIYNVILIVIYCINFF